MKLLIWELSVSWSNYRRRNAERKLDQWRFVINNLQESNANEENLKRATLEGSGVNVMETPPSNVRKAGKRNKKTKKINNKEDEWQGRNLLTSPNYDEEDALEIMALDPRDMETMLKYPMPITDEELYRQHQLSRKNSKSGRYSLARSRDSQLESSIWVEYDPVKDRPRSKRDLRHKRAKSGQWDPPTNRSCAIHAHPNNYVVQGELRKTKFTQSAPDILSLINPPLPVRNGDVCYHHTEICPASATSQARLGRSSTMAAVPPMTRTHRSNMGPPPQPPPRSTTIRC